jgi:Amt family ammonium transporter
VLLLSSAAWLVLKYTIGIRVSEAEELEGLDIGEHGHYAYPPHLVIDSFGTSSPAATAHATAGAGVLVGKASTEGA